MSGPKISVYSLTGRARAIVIGQMRCEQQSLSCFAKTKAIIKSLQSFSGSFDQQRRNLELLAKRTSEGLEQLETLQTLQEETSAEAEELKRQLEVQTPHISTQYDITEEAYAKKRAELKQLQNLQKRAECLNAKLQGAFDQVGSLGKQSSITHNVPNSMSSVESDMLRLQQSNAETIQKVQASIVDALSGVLSFELDDEAPDTSFQDKKVSIRKELSELLKDNSLPQEILNEIKQAIFALQRIETLQHLTTFDSITVTGIQKRIESFKHEEERKKDEFGELVSKYEALCFMAGEDAKSFPYTETAAKQVQSEIDRLEKLLVQQREQAYISDCVDEVMADMGYDLIGSREVRKKSGKHFRNELFSFSGGTAVNVTFASDGRITMELGGLAREDRIPTTEEAEVLTRDMESFCGEFAEFERRMLAKGIIVGDRIALSPPTPEYAAIINVNDYDLTESSQVSVLEISEKRRKQSEKKAMRRDERWS